MGYIKTNVKNRDAQSQYLLSQADMTQLWLGAFVGGYKGAVKRWFTFRRPRDPMAGIEKKATAFGCSEALAAISLYKAQGRLPSADRYIDEDNSHAMVLMTAEDLMAFYEPVCAEGFLAGWTLVVLGLLNEFDAYRDAVPCATSRLQRMLGQAALK